MIGQQVGNYRVVSKLGEGGMASVFEAVNEQIGKRAAIKVLHRDHAKNQQIAMRFINEARAINVVDHPGVVQVQEVGQLPDGTAYIVMELLKGETLNARMKSQGGKMPMIEAVRLGRQIASALAAAHAKEIIHRDLKPDNIMIVADSAFPGGERTKLLDFGIAKVKQEYQGSGDQVMTRAGVMMGTPLYMAPEQCRNASDVDDKADVYSLGVMLYRMLAGRPPFSAPGTGELMAMHIYMQPPPLEAAEPSLPKSLVELVHRMLAKNRTERPTMAQVAAELETVGIKASGMMPIVSASSVPALPASAINEGATVVSDRGYTPPPPPSTPLATGGPSVVVPPRGRATGIFIGAALVFILGIVGLVYYRITHRVQPVVEQPKPPEPPPEPVKPPIKIVRWHIESDPAGAEVVQTDTGEVLGQTPFRVEQPPKPGQIELQIRLKGHVIKKLTLDGGKDEEPPLQKLEPEKKRKKKEKGGK